MRQVFLPDETAVSLPPEDRCASLGDAYDRCPWAVFIVRTVSGYIAFESWDDHNTWLDQR